MKYMTVRSRSLRKVQGVMVGGKYYSRGDLDRMLREARQTKLRLDESRAK